MLEKFSEKHPILTALSGTILGPFTQLYDYYVEHPKQIEQNTKEADLWEKHQKETAHTRDNERIEHITGIFNELASRLKEHEVTLICHNNQDIITSFEEEDNATFYNILSLNAQVGPTTQKNRFLLSVNTDAFEFFDDDQLRFVFGHELSHLKNGDIDKQEKELKITSFFNAAVIAGAACLVTGGTPLVLAGSLGARFAYGMYNMRANHKKEYNADKTAVTDFNVPAKSAQFSIVSLDPFSYLSRNEKKTILQKISEYCGTHPPTDKRVAALEPLAQKEKKASALNR